MITQEKLTGYGANTLAAMIARGDVSSVEVVGAHIERIEEVNSSLNAVVIKRYEAARSVELGSAGLPVGVQVAVRQWHDQVTLAVMHALHQIVRTRPDYPRLSIA